jgi:hypothetical protein
MVIIEGPDHGGKSTLIQHIMGHFGSDALVLSDHSISQTRNKESFRSPEAVRKRVYDEIIAEVVGTDRPHVLDRLFFSELVYGSVLREHVCFPWKEQVHICRMLTALSPPIVFCMPPLGQIQSKIYGSTQMEGVTANIDAIYRKYDAMLALRHPKVTKYDYTKGPAARSRVCSLIEIYLKRRNERTP